MEPSPMGHNWYCTLRRSLRLGLAAGFSLLANPFPASAQIRINEILANPFGSDTGTERIEIYNAGTTPIDVTGWAIDDAATFDEVAVRARLPEDFDTSVCSGSAIILPGEYRVVKGTSTAAWVNNAGDDIYLITDRVSVPPPIHHQVTYGASVEGMSYSAVPDGSSNFAWQPPTFCVTNGGAGDVTAPATVTDLAATPGDFPGEVVLLWTAPGDDGATGTASEYRIKVSELGSITAPNFGAATDLEWWTNEPLPSPAGTPEEWTVFGLDPSTTYHFALIAIDDASNEGGVSNSPSTLPQSGLLQDPDLGDNVYFGNLHSHTGYSDGVLTPAQAYDFARYSAPTPLDFLAVTEHNHAGAGMSLANYDVGRAQAAAANDDGNFVAIFGQEWGFAANGHVNVFETEDLFGWEAGNYDVFVAEGDYASLYSAIVANPPDAYAPVASFCHPGSGDFNNFQVTADGLAVVRLMALVNGPAGSSAVDESDVGNTNYDGAFAEALEKGFRVSPVGDQDNHSANWGASSQSRTAVHSPALTKSAIMAALASGRTYATMDHNARVDFSADGHAMGEAFSSASGARISARVTDPDMGAGTSMIELFRGETGVSGATRIAFNENNDEFHWRELESFPEDSEHHYYLRIRLNSGNSIWTGPVYVTRGPATVSTEPQLPAGSLSLAPPQPNPARGNVTIDFVLPTAVSRARLQVFDLSGRLVRTLLDRPLDPGDQRVSWDGMSSSGTSVPAGLYFIRLAAGAETVTQKVIRLE